MFIRLYEHKKKNSAMFILFTMHVMQNLSLSFLVTLQVSVEDVEEEGDIVIEPNDPYSHRTLPYLIGSSEYCTDESVGITLLYQSDEESNKSEDEEEEEEEEEEDEDEGETVIKVRLKHLHIISYDREPCDGTRFYPCG